MSAREGLQERWFPVERVTRLSECRRTILMTPEPSTAEDVPRSSSSTQKRPNSEYRARVKPPAKGIIPSTSSSIAVTKTIGIYLNGEATTRFQQESLVATMTQPTNGVGEDWLPFTTSIDQNTYIGFCLSQHTSTGYSPSKLFLDREQPTGSYHDYVYHKSLQIQATFGIVRERMQRSAEVRAYKYDLRVKPKGFYYPAQSLDLKKSGPIGTKAHKN